MHCFLLFSVYILTKTENATLKEQQTFRTTYYGEVYAFVHKKTSTHWYDTCKTTAR